MSNDATEVQYSGWYPSPHTRGTFNVLQTCLSALFFCIYTALHFNVPWVYQSQWSRNLHLAAWMFISFFFPEIPVLAAVTQLIRATEVQKHFNNRYHQVYDGRPSKPGFTRERSEVATRMCDEKPERQLQHSYFSVMKGYQLVHESFAATTDVEDSNLSRLPRKPMALQLAPDYLIDLYLNTSFVPISLRELQDRSKATNVTRVVAILQTTYLIIQVTGRVASGLPVTELEINTISHIMCAWVAWLLWFSKPYSIEYPQTIQLAGELGARTACHWVLRETKNVNSLLTAFDLPHEKVFVDEEEPTHRTSPKAPSTLKVLAGAVRTFRSILSAVVVLEGIPTVASLSARQYNPVARFVVLIDHEITAQQYLGMVDAFRNAWTGDTLSVLTIINNVSGDGGDDRAFPSSTAPGTDWKCTDRQQTVILANPWEFALQHRFWTDPRLQDETLEFEQTIGQRDTSRETETETPKVKVFKSHCYMIDWDALSSNNKQLLFPYLIILPLFMAYGGLQAALWNSQFPTLIEKQMWRYSAVIVCAAPAILAWTWNGVVFRENFLAVVLIATHLIFLQALFGRGFLKWLSRMLRPLHLLISIVGALVFVMAQMFLVVDSFISLRRQPVQIYQ